MLEQFEKDNKIIVDILSKHTENVDEFFIEQKKLESDKQIILDKLKLEIKEAEDKIIEAQQTSVKAIENIYQDQEKLKKVNDELEEENNSLTKTNDTLNQNIILGDTKLAKISSDVVVAEEKLDDMDLELEGKKTEFSRLDESIVNGLKDLSDKENSFIEREEILRKEEVEVEDQRSANETTALSIATERRKIKEQKKSSLTLIEGFELREKNIKEKENKQEQKQVEQDAREQNLNIREQKL